MLSKKIKILFFLLIILTSFGVKSQILHLELGVANYSPSDDDDINAKFKILIDTVESLIDDYGAEGTIYINDYILDGLNEAAEYLKKYLNDRGEHKIEVITLFGDYNEIEFPFVRTAHLKNPGFRQLPNMDSDITSNELKLNTLKKISEKSESGLQLTSYFYTEGWDVMSYIQSLLADSGDYLLVDLNQEGLQYFFPNGDLVESREPSLGSTTRVYELKRNTPICNAVITHL